VDALLAVMTADNMATTKLASGFSQLVEKFSQSNTAEIGKILKHGSNSL